MINQNYTNDTIKRIFSFAKIAFDFDELEVLETPVVDENDINKAMQIMKSGTLGKGNNYINELSIALCFEEVERITPIKSTSKELLAYVDYLCLDGVTKYILEQAYRRGCVDSNVISSYEEKVHSMNDYISEEGPIEAFYECMDVYLEICNTILIMVGKEIYGCVS